MEGQARGGERVSDREKHGNSSRSSGGHYGLIFLCLPSFFSLSTSLLAFLSTAASSPHFHLTFSLSLSFSLSCLMRRARMCTSVLPDAHAFVCQVNPFVLLLSLLHQTHDTHTVRLSCPAASCATRSLVRLSPSPSLSSPPLS